MPDRNMQGPGSPCGTGRDWRRPARRSKSPARQAAALLGAITYVPEKACKHGHLQRYTKTGKCVSCMRVHADAWKRENPEQYRATIEAWRDRNRERVNELNRVWKKRHPESTAASAKKYREANASQIAASSKRYQPTRSENTRRWAAENPERQADIYRRYQRRHPDKIKSHCHKRRARKAAAAGFWTDADISLIRRLQNGCCAYCGTRDGLHVDHVIPLSRGGSNWPWNLQLLCAFHNTSKGSRTDLEYRRVAGLPDVPFHSSAILFMERFGF